MLLTALTGIPEVQAGDDLAGLLLAAAGEVRDGDVIAVAQKIVSKAEARLVALADVQPSPRACALAEICGKPPALVELVLGEADELVRCVPGILIVRHRLGFVVANAAIDQSNVPEGEGFALLLPVDPDASALRLRQDILVRTRATVGILIVDSFGRAWRHGVCGTCIGAAGITVLSDQRGYPDRSGRTMQATMIGAGDELAAAASLLMGQADEGTPAVLIRGAPAKFLGDGTACELVRPRDQDLFR